MLKGIWLSLIFVLATGRLHSEEQTETIVEFTQNSLESEMIGDVRIALRRVGPDTNSFSVDFRTVSGAALAGSDFVATNGTVNFAAGETSRVFNVTLIDDLEIEPEEDFTIVLENPTDGISLGTYSQRSIRITNNERDGGLDRSFAGNFSDAILHLDLQSDGNAIVTTGQPKNAQLRRIVFRGSEDPNFQAAPFQYLERFSIDSSNRIVFLANTSMTDQKMIGRLLPNGELDTEFQTNVFLARNTIVSPPLILADQSVIVPSVRWPVGVPSIRLYLERIHPSGEVASNTNLILAAGLGTAPVLSLAPGGDSFYAIGEFSTFNGFSIANFARFSLDGEIDTNFVVRSDLTNYPYATQIAFQSDGKLLLAGNFGPHPAGGTRHLVRLNSDGSLDEEFQMPQIERFLSTVQISGLLVDDKDRILVAGNFLTVNGTNKNALARLLPNGALDLDFHFATTFTGNLTGIALDAHDRITLAGSFLFIDRVPRLNVGRVYNGFTLPPALGISLDHGSELTVKWPSSIEGYRIQKTTRLGMPWSDAEDEIQVGDTGASVAIPTANDPSAYFRLVKTNSAPPVPSH